MCFKKREKIDTEFFLYLCEEYFENKHAVSNDDYDDIIIETSMEISPEMNNIDSSVQEELMHVCRRLAVKTLISIDLQRDRKNRLINLLVAKYPEEVEMLLKSKLNLPF